MRRFNSYGPIDTDLHYYAPRKTLIDKAYSQLMGENPQKGGHYITVWAPHQTGKTWVMQQILFQLQKDPRFDVLKINLEHLKEVEDVSQVIMSMANAVGDRLGKDFKGTDTREKFQEIFRKEVLDKPLILILDEFDALEENSINTIVSAFRNIYINRLDALELKSFKDMYRFEKSIDQAAEYGRQMGLKEIFLLEFVELSEEDAKQLEQEVDKSGIKVIVLPIGIL